MPQPVKAITIMGDTPPHVAPIQTRIKPLEAASGLPMRWHVLDSTGRSEVVDSTTLVAELTRTVNDYPLHKQEQQAEDHRGVQPTRIEP